MRVLFCSVSLFALFCGVFHAAVDPFYTRVQREGEALYAAGRFDEAAENFRVAGFGLAGDRDALIRLHFYAAACEYKRGRGDAAREVLTRLESLFGEGGIDRGAAPSEIRTEVAALLGALAPGSKTVEVPGGDGALSPAFEALLETSLAQARTGRIGQAENGLRRLRRMDGDDIRLAYLSGIIAFEKKDYRECISDLQRVFYTENHPFPDRVVYYLTIAHYFAGNYGQTLAFHQKVAVAADRAKLQQIVAKVRENRRVAIEILAVRFERRGYRDLVERFAGDSGLAADLLVRARQAQPGNAAVLKEIIREARRHPKAANLDFYLAASDHWQRRKDLAEAIEVLEDSPLYRPPRKDNVALFYRLAELHMVTRDWQRAWVEMSKVHRLAPDYKDVKDKLEILNRVKQGG